MKAILTMNTILATLEYRTPACRSELVTLINNGGFSECMPGDNGIYGAHYNANWIVAYSAVNMALDEYLVNADIGDVQKELRFLKSIGAKFKIRAALAKAREIFDAMYDRRGW